MSCSSARDSHALARLKWQGLEHFYLSIFTEIQMAPSTVVSPKTIAANLTELWSPRVVAELDESYVKVAKVKGILAWHSHEFEDELFYILKGVLKIEMEDRTVVLGEGETFVVPKGVRHNPIADEECLIMLIERKSTLHTGAELVSGTRSVADQLRSV